IEALRGGGRNKARGKKKVHRADCATHVRIEDVALQGQIGASGEFLLEGKAERLEFRAGSGSGHRFGNQRAKSLVNAGNLNWLEANALIEADPAKGASIGKSDYRIAER